MIDLTSQAGQEFDRETGLNNYRARMYDTDLKRFYSVDPLHQFATLTITLNKWERKWGN